MRLFSSPGLQSKSGKPFCQRRKDFHLTEILFRVIDLKVLNSYSESEIQEPPAGLGFKITRMENHPDISDTEDYIKSIIRGFLLNVYGYLQHLDTR